MGSPGSCYVHATEVRADNVDVCDQSPEWHAWRSMNVGLLEVLHRPVGRCQQAIDLDLSSITVCCESQSRPLSVTTRSRVFRGRRCEQCGPVVSTNVSRILAVRGRNSEGRVDARAGARLRWRSERFQHLLPETYPSPRPPPPRREGEDPDARASGDGENTDAAAEMALRVASTRPNSIRSCSSRTPTPSLSLRRSS